MLSAEQLKGLRTIFFLGGSAEHLRDLWLQIFSFSAVPKLLLSAKDLVTLSFWEILESGTSNLETHRELTVRGVK